MTGKIVIQAVPQNALIFIVLCSLEQQMLDDAKFAFERVLLARVQVERSGNVDYGGEYGDARKGLHRQSDRQVALQ